MLVGYNLRDSINYNVYYEIQEVGKIYVKGVNISNGNGNSQYISANLDITYVD
jgi:hypothetical protein